MPQPIKIVFIGTGATAPFNLKKMPCIAVKSGRDLILLDLGECCQIGILKHKLHPVRSNLYILLSHLHVDHISGLLGFLHTLKLASKEGDVWILGPSGTKKIIEDIIETFVDDPLPFRILIREINLNKSFEHVLTTSYFRIFGFRTTHDVPSIGYALIERTKPKFNAKLADNLGIPPSKRKELLLGKTITLPNGKIVSPKDVLLPPPVGRKIIYTGDTRPIYNSTILDLFKNCDLLIHDATYIRERHETLAEERFHSTIEDAIDIALITNTKKLALFHISSRYKDRSIIQDIAIKYLKNKKNEKTTLEVLIPDDDDVLML